MPAMWGAIAMGGGAALGAVSGLLSGNGQAEVDSGFNSQVYAAMNDDQEVAGWMKDLYQYGDASPYGATPVPVYKSTKQTTAGYYYNPKTKQYMTEAQYIKKSRNGSKDLEKYGWTWQQAALKEGVSDANGQMALDQKNVAYLNEIQPVAQQYATDSLAAAASLLPGKTAAESATNQNIVDVMPGRTAAENATNLFTTSVMPYRTEADIATSKYTTETTPMKTQAVKDALAIAGRNTEDEAARQAGAEVAQAFNTKQQTLGEAIRRTGAVAGSGRMAGLQEDLDINRVKATAGARTSARTAARGLQFDQLSKAIQYI